MFVFLMAWVREKGLFPAFTAMGRKEGENKEE